MRWLVFGRDDGHGFVHPWNPVIAERHAATTARMLLGSVLSVRRQSPDVAEQRCNGCGHQWTGPAPVVLCGECWRLAWPFIWGGVNPDARPCPHGDPSCPCQDGDPCHYEDTATTKAMRPPPPAEAREDAWQSVDGILYIGTRDEDGFHPSHEGDVFDLVAALRAQVQALEKMIK